MLWPVLHVGTADSPGLAAGPQAMGALLTAVVAYALLVLRRPHAAASAGCVHLMLQGYGACIGRAHRGDSLRAVSATRNAQRPLAGSATAAWLILALGLVLGLLTFPTACRCGADLPHEHALFELSGHHHGGGSTAHAPGTGSAGDYDGLVLRVPDGAAIGQPVTLAVQLLTYPLLRRRRPVLPSSDSLPDGLALVLDPPPPRA